LTAPFKVSAANRLPFFFMADIQLMRKEHENKQAFLTPDGVE